MAALSYLLTMRGWTVPVLCRRSGVRPETTRSLVRGDRQGTVSTVDAIAKALDARVVVVPRDLTRKDHVDLFVAQLDLPPARANLLRRCLLAAALRPVDQLPAPNPAGPKMIKESEERR